MTVDEYELEDGSVVCGASLPIPPHGSMTVLGDDDSVECESALRELGARWGELWLELRHLLNRALEDGGIAGTFADGETVAYAGRMREGEFKADEGDIFLSFSLRDCVPKWDAFIRGSRIVHLQPSF